MKSIQIPSFGTSEVLALVDVPQPTLKQGQVLVKVKFAGVNPKDVMVRKGKLKWFSGSKFPQGLGHDFSGIVEASKSNKFKIGDRVFGMTNTWKTSAYSQFVAVPATEMALMPPSMSFEQGAAIPLAALTSLQAIRDLGHIKTKQNVCINGAAGGVGTFAIQIAKILGAKVTALASAKNHELCKSLGADQCLDYHNLNLEDLAHKKHFHLYYDVFGNQSLDKIKVILTAEGLMVTTIPNLKNVWQSVRTYFWPHGRHAALVIVKSKAKDLELLAKWFAEGKLKAVIEQTFTLENVALAHQAIETKHTRGKIVLEV